MTGPKRPYNLLSKSHSGYVETDTKYPKLNHDNHFSDYQTNPISNAMATPAVVLGRPFQLSTPCNIVQKSSSPIYSEEDQAMDDLCASLARLYVVSPFSDDSHDTISLFNPVMRSLDFCRYFRNHDVSVAIIYNLGFQSYFFSFPTL